MPTPSHSQELSAASTIHFPTHPQGDSIHNSAHHLIYVNYLQLTYIALSLWGETPFRSKADRRILPFLTRKTFPRYSTCTVSSASDSPSRASSAGACASLPAPCVDDTRLHCNWVAAAIRAQLVAVWPPHPAMGAALRILEISNNDIFPADCSYELQIHRTLGCIAAWWLNAGDWRPNPVSSCALRPISVSVARW